MTEKRGVIVPATHSYSVVTPVTDKDNRCVELYFEPILAWRIETRVDREGGLYSMVTPITIHGDTQDSSDYCIHIDASGEFVFPYDQRFRNASTVQDHFNKKLDKETKRAKQNDRR